MAVIRFNAQQKQRLIEMYNDVSLASKDFPKIIEQEMNIVFPYTEVQNIYNNLLNLPLRNRPRKKETYIIEFEDEVVQTENSEVEAEIEQEQEKEDW